MQGVAMKRSKQLMDRLFEVLFQVFGVVVCQLTGTPHPAGITIALNQFIVSLGNRDDGGMSNRGVGYGNHAIAKTPFFIAQSLEYLVDEGRLESFGSDHLVTGTTLDPVGQAAPGLWGVP